MNLHNNAPEKAAGFVLEAHSDYVIIYALHRGAVFCPKKSFSSSTWHNGAIGDWMELEIESLEEKLETCTWRATAVGKLPGEPPTEICYDSKVSGWKTRVRAVVGMTFTKFGTAWSPTIGRIQVCRKHVDLVSCGEEVEVDVHLHPSLARKQEHWISVDIVSRLNPDPSHFLTWCSDVRLFRAKITHINTDTFGFLENFQHERIFFGYSDFCLTNGERCLTKVGMVGSEWNVLVHAQTDPRNCARAPWRAIAVIDPEGLSQIVEESGSKVEGIDSNGEISVGEYDESSTLPAIVPPVADGAVRKTEDACCQTDEMEETRFIRSVYANRELFSQICITYPDMVRVMMSLNLSVTK